MSIPDERRQSPRTDVEKPSIQVFSENPSTLLGHLINISTAGFRILSDRKIASESSIPVHIVVDLLGRPTQRIWVTADCVWSRADDNPGFFVSGYKLVNASEMSQQRIRDLVDILSTLD